MKVKITYPHVDKTRTRRRVLSIIRWPFLLGGYASVIVNICVGGSWWSIIVVAALIGIWSMFIEIDLVEYNRISQFIKGTLFACLILALIDWLLVPGWAMEVVTIVCFSALTISGILFFTDLKRQKQNMLPMLLLILGTMIFTVLQFVLMEGFNWAAIVMGSISVLLLMVCLLSLGSEFFIEFKKRFHIK